MQKNHRKRIIILLFFILLFLCAVPAVSYAAQQQNALPAPSTTVTVPAGTTVASLGKILYIQSTGQTLTVFKADGTTRSSGPVGTGDLAVLTDAHGKITGCVKILVTGSESSGASQQPSQQPSSNGCSSSPQSSSLPDSGISSGEPGSGSSQQQISSVPSSSSSSGIPQSGEYVFTKPVTVESLQKTLDAQNDIYAARVIVTSVSGIRRESGYVCTGDSITVLDQNGQITSTVTADVLGDLTRCGMPTETGCSLLYSYLTNQSGLKSDLLSAADMNQDGRVDTADLLAMKKALNGGS